METNVPRFNKTNIRRAISWCPPGSHVGVIDFANIEVKKLKEENGDLGWKEAYIPFNLSTDSTIDLDSFASIIRQIERIWGDVPFQGSKGLIKRKRRNCVYLCFQPKTA